MFGAQASSSAFGTPSSAPAFGTPSSSPAFGTPSSTPAFGAPSSTPAFGTPSTPSFSTGGFGSLFSTPFSSQNQQQQQQQQQQPHASLFQQSGSASGFGLQTPFSAPQWSPYPNSQLTTQMAPVAPIPFSLADRDIQVVLLLFETLASFLLFLLVFLNLIYICQFLCVICIRQLLKLTRRSLETLNMLLSICYLASPIHNTERSLLEFQIFHWQIMWAEAMGKLEGMESADRERLWPHLVRGFKDLSQRLKIQDEVIVSDAERLHMTQSNVKMLQRHFQSDTLSRIERMRQKEKGLQRRLLRVMRIVEALEGKGCRLPLMKGEGELAEKLAAITRQLKGSGAELSRRVQNLLMLSRVQANSIGSGGSLYLTGSTKIDEQSLADMQEVLQQQTDAIARLGNVLKRDVRDMEIIMAEDTEMEGGMG